MQIGILLRIDHVPKRLRDRSLGPYDCDDDVSSIEQCNHKLKLINGQSEMHKEVPSWMKRTPNPREAPVTA